MSEPAAEEAEVEPADRAPSPEERVCRKELYECYRRYVEDLPASYRTVVALSELEDLASNEIADLLGLSAGVVKIRLYRGRVKLLKELKAHCKAEEWL